MTKTQKKIAERPCEIVERVAEFIRDGDLEGVVSMFHPKCKIAMDPAAEPLAGHDAVRTIFADFVKERLDLAGEVTGEMINDDIAILQGSWQINSADGTVLGGGQSTEVAKRLADGGWVYFIDCPISVPAP